MFEPKQGQIPGYTGHQKTQEEIDAPQRKGIALKQIPGKFSGPSLTRLKATLATSRVLRVRTFSARPTERPPTAPRPRSSTAVSTSPPTSSSTP